MATGEFLQQKLKIISRSYPRQTTPPRDDSTVAPEASNRFIDILIPLSPIDNEPFVIGSGGFATVFVAFEGNLGVGKPLAVKLLKKEQGTGTPNGRFRFIEEIYYNQLLSNTPSGTFVEYRGFGYVARNSRLSTDIDRREAAWVREGIDPEDISRVCEANILTSISPEFLSEHQDLFFVMAAAWCSLEQLLVSNQPLRNSNTIILSYEHERKLQQKTEQREATAVPATAEMNTAYGVAHNNLRADPAAVKHVAEIAKNLRISESTSGLEVLSLIRKHANLGAPVSTRLQLEILKKLAVAVGNIHQFQAPDAKGTIETLSLAHRDLKPANFLLDDCSGESPGVILSDLGFISSRQTIQTFYAAEVREPGALPLGSVMYQAPEQVVSGREVSFELVEAADIHERWATLGRKTEDWPTVRLSGKTYLAKAIRARKIGGISFQSGDRLVSTEIKLVAGADGGRMTVSSVASDPMYPTSEIVFVEQGIESNQTPRADYKALLLKPIGQHSDLFSLGCIAYFMASGGKDPSEFYRTYLRPQSGLIYLTGEESHRNCFEVATFLAGRNGALGQGRHVQALMAALSKTSWRAYLEAAEGKVKAFRASEERDYFLFSSDGTPIDVIFLYVIAKLMCRGIEGAYVTSSDQPGKTALEACAKDLKGFLGEVIHALNSAYSSVMEDDYFSKFADRGLGALLWVRLLAPSKLAR